MTIYMYMYIMLMCTNVHVHVHTEVQVHVPEIVLSSTTYLATHMYITCTYTPALLYTTASYVPHPPLHSSAATGPQFGVEESVGNEDSGLERGPHH